MLFSRLLLIWTENTIDFPKYLRSEIRISQLVQKVHCLAVAVSANYYVSNVVHHASELQSCRFAAEVLVLEVLGMGNQIASISHLSVGIGRNVKP